MIQGRILKAIGGFYYALVGDTLYECRARGVFKVRQQSPMVGDHVMVQVQTESPPTGVIAEILERSVVLQRPAVANVDQAIIVFAVQNPELHPILLDKLLILCGRAGIRPLICFNKTDLEVLPTVEELIGIYRQAGYDVMLTSALESNGLEELEGVLRDRVTVFAGPSGVGKSSLLNTLIPGLTLQTGAVSEKIGRGKHTTRHTELIPLRSGGWVVDTPGFTSLDLGMLEPKELAHHYLEFGPFLEACRFKDCMHLKEPGCAVVDHVGREIHPLRYDSYRVLVGQLVEDRRKRQW